MKHSDSEILFSAKKKRAISYENTWRKPKCVLLHKQNQPVEAIYYIIPTIRQSGKSKTMELVKRLLVASVE